MSYTCTAAVKLAVEITDVNGVRRDAVTLPFTALTRANEIVGVGGNTIYVTLTGSTTPVTSVIIVNEGTAGTNGNLTVTYNNGGAQTMVIPPGNFGVIPDQVYNSNITTSGSSVPFKAWVLGV